MIEYLPWSKAVFEDCMSYYNSGEYVILDIELGGQCNYQCIYCDSPRRDLFCHISLEKIEATFRDNRIKWAFICGLGEPTVNDNFQILTKILSFCEKYGAKCSIFTNLSNLNSVLEEYIKKQILYVMFKFDSNDIVKNISLYGVPNVKQQLYNIDRVKRLVSVTNCCTNVAASIVPTQINKNDIIDIVKECLDCNIFPLIAELENSGVAQDYYSQLSLSVTELEQIRSEVNAFTGEYYQIPVCPSVICGIHIRHDGNVTVDEHTGLSCHWFWLEEPRTKIIGNFNSGIINDIINNLDLYRKNRIDDVKSLLSQQYETVFGGCGGDINYLLRRYLEINEGGKA